MSGEQKVQLTQDLKDFAAKKRTIRVFENGQKNQLSSIFNLKDMILDHTKNWLNNFQIKLTKNNREMGFWTCSEKF